jgi:hypothetical protein
MDVVDDKHWLWKVNLTECNNSQTYDRPIVHGLKDPKSSHLNRMVIMENCVHNSEVVNKNKFILISYGWYSFQ